MSFNHLRDPTLIRRVEFFLFLVANFRVLIKFFLKKVCIFYKDLPLKNPSKTTVLVGA